MPIYARFGGENMGHLCFGNCFLPQTIGQTNVENRWTSRILLGRNGGHRNWGTQELGSEPENKEELKGFVTGTLKFKPTSVGICDAKRRWHFTEVIMQEFARTNLDVRHKIAKQNDASQDLISRTGDASNQYRDLQCKKVVLSNKHGDLHAILGGYQEECWCDTWWSQ